MIVYILIFAISGQQSDEVTTSQIEFKSAVECKKGAEAIKLQFSGMYERGICLGVRK